MNTESEMVLEKECHYFISTLYDWRKAKTLGGAIHKIQKLRSYSKGVYWVAYRVPLPIKSKYAIEDYKPQVPGTLYLGKGKVR